jgi:hypothetical protein
MRGACAGLVPFCRGSRFNRLFAFNWEDGRRHDREFGGAANDRHVRAHPSSSRRHGPSMEELEPDSSEAMRFTSHELARLKLRAGVSPAASGAGNRYGRPSPRVYNEGEVPGLSDDSRGHARAEPPPEHLGYNSSFRHSPSSKHLDAAGAGPARVGDKGHLRAVSMDAEGRSAYLKELDAQVRDKVRAKEMKKREEMEWERKKEEEAGDFFLGARRRGGGGGGEPIRDAEGRPVANLKRLGVDLVTFSPSGGASPADRPRPPPDSNRFPPSVTASPGFSGRRQISGRGVHWEGGAMASALADGGGVDHRSPSQIAHRGVGGPSPHDRASAAASYREELAAQVAEKKRLEMMRKREEEDFEILLEKRDADAGIVRNDMDSPTARRRDVPLHHEPVHAEPERAAPRSLHRDFERAMVEDPVTSDDVAKELAQRLGRVLADNDRLKEENESLQADCKALEDKLGEAIDILEQYREEFGLLGQTKPSKAARSSSSSQPRTGAKHKVPSRVVSKTRGGSSQLRR